MPSTRHRKEFAGLVLDTPDRHYALQQRLMRGQQHTLTEDDQLFIASYKHLPEGRPDGLKTVCAWPKDAPSLLPKTDAIAFVTGTKFRGIVPWSLVAAQMSDELEPAGTYPERYSALSFPTAEQLVSLVQRLSGGKSPRNANVIDPPRPVPFGKESRSVNAPFWFGSPPGEIPCLSQIASPHAR